jgi:hypothetical protein
MEHRSLPAILILGFFQLGLAYILFQVASGAPSLNASLLAIVEPLMSRSGCSLVLGEKPAWLWPEAAVIISAWSFSHQQDRPAEKS